MITEIEIEGFKSLEKVRLELGGLNLFIGANASGKSNFLDALRILQGIGYGLTVDEIFNGKPKSAASEVWEGIRGGISKAVFMRRDSPGDFLGKIRLALRIECPGPVLSYSVEISAGIHSLIAESLKADDRLVFSFSVVPGHDSSQLEEAARKEGSGLEANVPYSCQEVLRDIQRVDPNPEVIRQYSQSRSSRRIGERGENFAALVKSILGNEVLSAAYLSWLRQLTPMEFDDVTILEGALGEPLFALKEGNEILPAPILSDGTLRFAAITAAFFQPDMPGIITLEEIENGIHPSRLRLLVELLKSQTRGASAPQVFATTHSPVVLAWLDEEDYKSTFLCRRDEETGASIITPLSEIPHLIDLVRKQPIGDLFTEGWLEGAF